MLSIYIAAGGALLVSLFFSRKKTFQALALAVKKLLGILPLFLLMTIGVSLLLFLLPDTLIPQALGGAGSSLGVLFAALIGSIAFVPGFIVFPLCGLLRGQGVSYMVLSAFTTTLMMVGILTFPMEQKYLGTPLALVRNITGFVIALIVALATGIIFGEVF